MTLNRLEIKTLAIKVARIMTESAVSNVSLPTAAAVENMVRNNKISGSFGAVVLNQHLDAVVVQVV